LILIDNNISISSCNKFGRINYNRNKVGYCKGDYIVSSEASVAIYYDENEVAITNDATETH
jgi:hypothetical protein